jgi:hypothetical protein
MYSNALQSSGSSINLQAVMNPIGLAGESESPVIAATRQRLDVSDETVPLMPKSLTAAGLHKNDLFPLVLKYLFLHGHRSGTNISHQLKLPFNLLEPIVAGLKSEALITPRGLVGAGDFEYELTPKGVEQAKLHLSRSSYCGAAPVSLADYRNSVAEQSIRHLKPRYQDVKQAYHDLFVSDLTINQLGQALNSSRPIFIFGAPGNGKTSIAVRAIRTLNEIIWIPRALTVGGEVIRLYDPAVHEAMPLPSSGGITREIEVDERWIRIRRPTIIVGGELEMKHLDATLNPVTGIIEAPIHLKSNCGCLIVDDFGRQQIAPAELLNRWIVPMESGCDFINLPSGRQIALPFEQLLIFSTNLEPAKLCDEAFLRRIPYKIEVFDPTEKQFRELFDLKMQEMGFQVEPGVIDRLIEYHFKRVGRSFRFCHVVDLLNQAKDFCEFHRQPLVFKKDIAELAVLNYFSGTHGQLNV